jgi:hypothetical protein
MRAQCSGFHSERQAKASHSTVFTSSPLFGTAIVNGRRGPGPTLSGVRRRAMSLALKQAQILITVRIARRVRPLKKSGQLY